MVRKIRNIKLICRYTNIILMKLTSRALFILFVVACISSCAKPEFLYESEKLSPNGYAQYKTYAFQPTTDTAFTKMFDKQNLQKLMSTAAIRELSKKGMTLDTSHPDCFFTYHLIVNRTYEGSQQQHVEYNPNVYTPAFDNDAKIYVFSSDNKPVVYAGKMYIDTLREGSIVIDMIDPKSGAVVWRSSMQGKTQETFQQPTEAGVNEVMHYLFKKFPK
jgi:hypothetical protein